MTQVENNKIPIVLDKDGVWMGVDGAPIMRMIKWLEGVYRSKEYEVVLWTRDDASGLEEDLEKLVGLSPLVWAWLIHSKKITSTERYLGAEEWKDPRIADPEARIIIDDEVGDLGMREFLRERGCVGIDPNQWGAISEQEWINLMNLKLAEARGMISEN